MKCVHGATSLLLFFLVGACGGSSSETPMPLEPLPHAGPEPNTDNEPEATSASDGTEGETPSAPEEDTVNSAAGAEDDAATSTTSTRAD